MEVNRIKFPIKTTIAVALGTYLMCLSLTFPETNAYLKEEDHRSEMTQIGDLKVALNDSGTATTVPVTKDQIVDRKVSVTNKGQEALFLRVLIHPTLVSKEGVQKEVSVDELVVDLNTSEWRDGKDGYYYYIGKLEPGANATTPELFTQINGIATMVEDDKLELFLKTEAITSSNQSYREAWWENQTPSEEERPELAEVDRALAQLMD